MLFLREPRPKKPLLVRAALRRSIASPQLLVCMGPLAFCNAM